MKVYPGHGISALVGKIGNTVYTTVDGRIFGKLTPSYVGNPNTPEQAAARSALGTMSTGWDALSTANQNLWKDAVNLLGPRPTTVLPESWFPRFYNDITPRAYYIGLNCYMSAVGFPTLTAPPPSGVIPTYDTALNIAPNHPTTIFVFQGGYNYDTLPLEQHRLVVYGRLRESGANRYLSFSGLFTPNGISSVDFGADLTPLRILQWRIGTGQNITMVDISTLPLRNWELRAEVIRVNGLRGMCSESFFLSSTV